MSPPVPSLSFTRVRILLISAHGADLSAGGTERYVSDLARGLAARGHETQVLAAFPTRDDTGGSATVLHRTHWRDDRVRRLRNHAGDVLAVRNRRVAELIEAAQPDLVHTNNLAGFSTSIWESARRLGLPLVHTLHDYHLLCPRVSLMQRDGSPCCPHATFCKLRTRRLARWAGAVSDVVCGSDHLWARLGHLFPRAHPHVVRVPVVPLADRALRSPGAPLRTVGYLGGIDRIKGIDALLEAAPALHERGIELRLAGNGRLRSLVEANVGPGLSYSGTVLGEARLRFFEEADLAVVPSAWEEANGPPYVVAEWLAAGRPVLASTRGGLGEAAQLPGVLPIEPTAGGIVSAVEQLTDERIWRETIASVARPQDDADLERWLDDHEAVYERAAARLALRSSTSS